MVFQNDVDVPLTPRPKEKLFFSTAIQEPAVECDTCEDDPAILVDEGWTIKVEPVYH
ncbi:MAG: hypothetical protein WC732_01410 [Candidatus Omnitrophota bacterium]